MLRPARAMSTAAKSSLKIGVIPADGVGKEVIPVSTAAFALWMMSG